MSTPAKAEKPKKERERQDWVIVLLILLLGLCCVAGAGQYALRFAPSWQLDTDMESNIDLNSQFLTGKPQGFFEPIDPAILTQPGWVNGNIFLTPGAFTPGTPLPTSTAGTLVPTTLGTTAVATNVISVTDTTIPTNTLVWIPLPATRTRRPPPADTATDTPLPPPASVDLQITKSDVPVTALYNQGDPIVYTIVVSNPSGPSNVTGAEVTDNIPSQITNWTWTCAAELGGASGCNGMTGNMDFNDIVDLPVGGSIEYTVTAQTANSLGGGNLTNTATVSLPTDYTDPGPLPNSASDSDVPSISTSPDGNFNDLPAGAQLILNVNLVADGDLGIPDLVYYEVLNSGSPDFILLDQVRIEISDGSGWVTIFDWGDGNPDTNTNVSGLDPLEQDEFRIDSGPPLYNGSGVAIDIDSIVSGGPYIYIQITSSPYGAGIDNTTDIDAIEILP